MIELKDLLEENETLVTFHLCNEYWSRNAITVKGNDDISGALEMTLHRILEAGGTENDVKRIMGAEIPTEDELKELEEFDEYSNIGINRLTMLIKEPTCNFVLYVGNKRLIKRKLFDEFIENINMI